MEQRQPLLGLLPTKLMVKVWNAAVPATGRHRPENLGLQPCQRRSRGVMLCELIEPGDGLRDFIAAVNGLLDHLLVACP
jgi:hypothetical protein